MDHICITYMSTISPEEISLHWIMCMIFFHELIFQPHSSLLFLQYSLKYIHSPPPLLYIYIKWKYIHDTSWSRPILSTWSSEQRKASLLHILVLQFFNRWRFVLKCWKSISFSVWGPAMLLSAILSSVLNLLILLTEVHVEPLWQHL